MRLRAFSENLEALQASEVMNLPLPRLDFRTEKSENVHYPSVFLILKIALMFAHASVTTYALS